jgi:CHASE3 domain sensor protein
MPLRMRETVAIFTPGSSFRRRVAYSFAIVRLVLARVIVLAVYYLLQMGWIVDRIVSVDAPAATLAQQASIQMLEARRAERNYSLLRDTAYVNTNHDLLAEVTDILTRIRNLEPEEQASTQKSFGSDTSLSAAVCSCGCGDGPARATPLASGLRPLYATMKEI